MRRLTLLPLLFAVVLVVGAQQETPSAAPVGAPASYKWVEGQTELDLLLNPKALGAKAAPETPAELRRKFNDPPAEYRSMPLWVWNDEMSWPRMQEQLRQFKAQGMGGVFIHPRPGMMTEYLSPEWFRLWRLSLEEGKRLGIQVNIYDENSYPAGFAGGHVPARAPETVLQYLSCEQDVAAGRAPWGRSETLAIFALERGADGRVVSAKRVSSGREVPDGQKVAVLSLKRVTGGFWTAGFPYVDLTNPATAVEFLKSTYEPYKAHFGAEFGKTLKYAFNDEPQLLAGGTGPYGLPLTRYSLAEFKKRCGYDLLDNLASLYWDVGDWRKVRFDYWQTIHDLWKENFFRPLFQWSDRNNLQFTGHWMEHEWPYPWITPADASFYAFEHMPGIDLLEGANLRKRGADEHYLFTIKQVASVSNQLGRRVFCEAYGVAGWDSTFEHYKRFGDWLMVHGIDFMNQHLSFSTIRGARKRDHPQSFTDVSAWWPYYKLHGDHLGRVSYMLSRGVAANRVAVLEPTTSGFLWARRGAGTPELAAMKTSYGELVQYLADRQVDFDLVDEYILEWFGKQSGKRLTVGKASYDLLVWPKDMTNVRGQTVAHLEKYLAGGGEILALSEPAAYVDGRASGKIADLRARYAAQWRMVDELGDLAREIHKRAAPRVVLDRELPRVGMAERTLENGERVLFFANTGLEAARAEASVEGGALEIWDTVSGKSVPAGFTREGAARLRFHLDLAPAGSLLLLVKKSGAAAKPAPVPAYTPIDAASWKIAPEAPNVLALDYCDLKLSNAEYSGVNTWRANYLLWLGHGYERPMWDNTIQFKRRFFDMAKVMPKDGFEATFRFQVDDANVLKSLELAIEAPELYKVTVNGQPLSFAAAKRWLDPHLRSASIAALAVAGENVVKITGKPFDVRMELENIYVRGNFSVTARERGFSIAAPATLTFGSWLKQGRPFDGASVLYQTEVSVPAGSNRVKVELSDLGGTLAEVLVDGKRAGIIAWQPLSVEFAATPGKHTIGVRLVSTPHNTLGPFHNPVARMRAWPGAWATFPEKQPAGAQYDLLDYGLTAAPAISAAKVTP
jgi:hypothetical protein